MNPFRDRSPERAAERLLNELRQGNIGVLATVDLEVADPSSRSHIVEQESKWPVQGWRIGRRKQKPDRTELMYWVTRGNGYSEDGYEEEVYVTVRGSGPSARVIDFAAIY